MNDCYRRFVRPRAAEQHYVWISRATTVAIMVLSAILTFYLESIRQAWEFVLESGAGIGLVLILRWYWWRVNAWSEITAMIAPALGYAFLRTFTAIQFPYTLIYLVGWTTLAWLIVTLVTPPEPRDHLLRFYRRVRPGGPGWTAIAGEAGGPPPEPIRGLLIDWLAGAALVYAVLFGVGALILSAWIRALLFGGMAVIAAVVIQRDLTRRGWKAVTG